MTINNINSNANKAPIDGQKLAQQQAQSQTAGNTVANQSSPQTAAPKADSVSLTASAQQLSQVQKKGGTEAPVNQEKVDHLKKAISSGEYQINPEALAQKISKLEAQILGFGAK